MCWQCYSHLKTRHWICLTGAQAMEHEPSCNVWSKSCHKSLQQRVVASIPVIEPAAHSICLLTESWLLYTLLHFLPHSCIICSSHEKLDAVARCIREACICMTPMATRHSAQAMHQCPQSGSLSITLIHHPQDDTDELAKCTSTS